MRYKKRWKDFFSRRKAIGGKGEDGGHRPTEGAWDGRGGEGGGRRKETGRGTVKEGRKTKESEEKIIRKAGMHAHVHNVFSSASVCAAGRHVRKRLARRTRYARLLHTLRTTGYRCANASIPTVALISPRSLTIPCTAAASAASTAAAVVSILAFISPGSHENQRSSVGLRVANGSNGFFFENGNGTELESVRGFQSF